MKFTLNLTEEDVKALKAQLKVRMRWIQAGMDEREPIDFAMAKVVAAYDEEKQLLDIRNQVQNRGGVVPKNA